MISKRVAAWLVGGALALGLAGGPAAAQTADLRVTVAAAPNPVLSGSNAVFTVTVTNSGPDTAAGVVVNHTLPPGFTLVSAAISGSGNKELIATNKVWKYDESGSDLGTGWTATDYSDAAWLTGTATFGTNKNVALAWPFNTILDRSNNNAYVLTYYFRTTFEYQGAGTATLQLVDLIDDAVIYYLNGQQIYRDTNFPAGDVNYQTKAASAITDAALRTNLVVVSNLVSGANCLAAEVHQGGGGVSSDVVFGLRVHTVAPFQTWTTNASGQVVFTLGDMGSGESAVLTVIAKSGALGQGDTTVVVNSSTEDPNPGNNAAQASVTVQAYLADLGLTLTDTPDPVYVGSNLVYTIKLTNGGPVDATSVMVTNFLPFSVTFLNATIAGAGTVSQAVNLVTFTNTAWKYNQSGIDLGTNWVAPAYDDSGWSNGLGMFGFDNSFTSSNISPAPVIRTSLSLSNSIGFTYRFYFRTPFNYTGPATNTMYFLSQIDDGLVLYLNGKEILRDNMPSGLITNTTLASSTPEAVLKTNWVVVSNLVSGVNSFAAEVHQGSTGSSDVVFGLRADTFSLVNGTWSTGTLGQVVFNLGTIPSGAAATMSVTVRPNAPQSITSRAITRSGVPDNFVANNSVTNTTLVQRVPQPVDLSITAVASPEPVAENLLVTNSFTIYNSGPSNATSVRLTNSFGVGLVYQGSSGDCTLTNGVVVCSVQDISSNAQKSITMVFQANEPGRITNLVTVGTADRDTNPANNSVAVVSTVLPMRAEVSVTSQIRPSPMQAGDFFTNLVTVVNAGPTNADNLVLTNLQAGGTIQAVRINGVAAEFVDLGSGRLTCALGSLPSGGSLAVTLEGQTLSVGSVAATVSVGASQKDPNPANNSAVASARVNPASVVDLVLATSIAPATVYNGDSFTYCIGISNVGGLAGTGVVLTNLLPPSVTLLSVTNSQGTATNYGRTVVCNLGTIAGSSSATVLVQVVAIQDGVATNFAFAGSAQAEFNPVDNLSVFTNTIQPSITADLALSVVPSVTNLYAGEEVSFRISLTNNGPLEATGILVTNWIPMDCTFLRASTTAGSFFSPTSGVIVFSPGRLARHAAMQASVVVRPTAAGLVTNVVDAGADQPDPVASRVEAVVKVLPSADLVLSLSGPEEMLSASAAAVYSLTVRNDGPSPASGVNAYAYLPISAAFLGGYVSQGTFTANGTTVLWNVGSLPAGSEVTFEMDVVPGNATSCVVTAGVLAKEHDPVANNTVVASNSVVTGMAGKGITITPSMDPLAMAAVLTAGGATGIKVTSVQLKANGFENTMSSGLYSVNGTNNYGLMMPGVVLSTGNVADYGSGPSLFTNKTTAYGSFADFEEQQLLDPITTDGTNHYYHYDVTQLDIYFDMMPDYDLVSFNVVFGTEEFSEYVGSEFIDGFGIYLDGVNIAYTAGAPINVNHPDMAMVPETELDGVVNAGGKPVMLFKAPVMPGTANHRLTFILGDTSDDILDTTVYVASLKGARGVATDVGVTATASPDPVRVGAPLTYTIQVTNVGPNIATNTVVTGIFAEVFADLAGSTATGSFGITNGMLLWQVGDLPRHGGATLTITATPLFDSQFLAWFEVQSSLTDPNRTNNSAYVLSSAVDLGSFYNLGQLVIRDGATANPYPSIIHVAGLTGVVDKVVVTLLGLNHTFPADISALLVGPDGRGTILMAQAGAGNGVQNISLTFDDAAAEALPFNGTLQTGLFRPSSYGVAAQFPGLAALTQSAYANALAHFRRLNPNGDWQLYLFDGAGGDAGTLDGWNLRITTAPELVPVMTGGSMAISWPDMAGDSLEAATSLAADALWTPVVQTPVVAGGMRTVTLPVGSGYRFFRLRK